MLYTLRDMVIQVGWPFRDNLKGRTTLDAGGSQKNVLIDESLKGDKDDRWFGSEVLFSGVLTTENPKTVNSSNSVTGALTLDSDWNSATGVPANTDYVLMRLRGMGVPFDYRLSALEHAINRVDAAAATDDLGVVVNGSAYPIPEGYETVWRVWLKDSRGAYEIPFRRWALVPGGQLELASAYTINSTDPFHLYISGTYLPSFSTNLDSTYNVSSGVIDDAIEWLTLMSQRPNEQAGGNKMFTERQRRDGGDYRRPNERRVLR
jgi:hypothetical protein